MKKINHNSLLAIQCRKIKSLVEEHSGIEDIGLKSRKRELSDLKKIYCKLCRIHTKASLDTIGLVLRDDYDHSSVFNCIKKFDILYPNKQIVWESVFRSVTSVINQNNLFEKDKNQNYFAISNFINFLDWFKEEIGHESTIDSSYYVGKYMATHCVI